MGTLPQTMAPQGMEPQEMVLVCLHRLHLLSTTLLLWVLVPRLGHQVLLEQEMPQVVSWHLAGAARWPQQNLAHWEALQRRGWDYDPHLQHVLV